MRYDLGKPGRLRRAHRSEVRRRPAAPIFAKYADRGAYLIDLKDVYCPDGTCPVVQGNVYMYADSNHLTNVYEATLTDIIYERALATGWNPQGRNAQS